MQYITENRQLIHIGPFQYCAILTNGYCKEIFSQVLVLKLVALMAEHVLEDSRLSAEGFKKGYYPVYWIWVCFSFQDEVRCHLAGVVAGCPHG